MKKVLFPIIFISLVNISIFAQNKQGSLAIGGTFNLDVQTQADKANNTTTDGPTITTFKLVPTAEYFITDKFSVGMGIGYDNVRTKTVPNPNTTVITNSGWPVIMPFARMYFPMGEKVSIFGQASFDIEPGSTKTKTTTANVTISTKENDFFIQAGITPGISLSLSNTIAIDASFGFIGLTYHNVKQDANNSTTTTNATFKVDPSSFIFGVKFFIF